MSQLIFVKVVFGRALNPCLGEGGVCVKRPFVRVDVHAPHPSSQPRQEVLRFPFMLEIGLAGVKDRPQPPAQVQCTR